MNPSFKSPEIEGFLNKTFGIDRSQSIKKNKCVAPPIGCGKPIANFRDEISRKEYTISGLCQKCQDEIWEKTDD